MNHNSILKGSLVILLIVLFLMLGSAIALVSVSADNYPVKATFSYTFYVQPGYINETSFGVIQFVYWSNYGIVEPQYSDLFANRLKVIPEEDGLQNSNVLVNWYTQDTDNPYHSGLLFQASSYGLEFPYQTLSSLNPENSPSCNANITDIIARNGIVNNTIVMTCTLESRSIIASVSDHPTDSTPLNYALINGPIEMDCYVYVNVVDGVPIQVSSGNMTTSGTILPYRFFYFQTLNWTYQNSLDVPNPSILQAKQDVPYLLVASVILVIAIVPVTYYYSKSKQIMNNDKENKADSARAMIRVKHSKVSASRTYVNYAS